jgi:putative hemolysin
MRLLLIFLFALPVTTFAKGLNYTNENGKTKKIAIIDFNGFSVNDVCANKLNNCQALLATKLVRSISSLDTKRLVGHPASKMCFAKGGSSIILKDPKRNEYDYCLFPDGSMIDSWQLKKGQL